MTLLIQRLIPCFAPATLLRLTQLFERESLSVSDDSPYHPALLPLYTHFCSILYSICSPFTHDPYELAYISAARWPGFVQPILDEHRHQADLRRQQREESGMDIEDNDSELKLAPPPEDTRMRLTRFFTSSFTTALEALYPRLTNASSWARENAPESGLLALPPARTSPLKSKPSASSNGQDTITADVLPRMSKFILVAAFLASTNPAKTDLRMFGRGSDGSKKRRKGGSPRKGSGKNTVAKVGNTHRTALDLVLSMSLKF
jgi:origin recognition complex subunit 5